MASKNATVTTKSDSGSVANGGRAGNNAPSFVKYRLNDDEMAQAKEACTSMSDVGEILTQMVDEGYKISVSHDDYGGGMQAFMTPGKRESVNSGWTLTARAPTLLAAVGVLAWKHYTLFSQIWPKEAETRQGQTWG